MDNKYSEVILVEQANKQNVFTNLKKSLKKVVAELTRVKFRTKHSWGLQTTDVLN